ncbi:McrB family protein [Persephonella sp.]
MIVGLYASDKEAKDKNSYLKEFNENIKIYGCDIGFWWSAKPEDEVLKQLTKLINKIGYFYFYMFYSHKAIALLKIEDFYVFEDPYNDDLPESWKNCGNAELWFNKEKRKKLIDKEKDNKKPKIIFKVKEIIFFDENKKTNFEGNPNPKWIGQDMDLVKFIDEFKNEKKVSNEINKLKSILLQETCLKKLKLDEYIKNSFYNSLKTKGFVILAGLSGTGKTKIFEEFVNCFPNQKDLFFPIRPDFKDTKSLLGFYNPLKKQYHSTLLLNFVLEASKNYLEKGKEADPFFVLFDEMNLARVEYYFADFLSVLETKRFETKDEAVNNEKFANFLDGMGRNASEINENNYKFSSQSIKLHSEDKDLKDKHGNIIPQELFLPPNLYFVGTVNIDETTHMFSPKVLDRAFTIEFDVGSFDDYLKFLNKAVENVDLADETKQQLKQDFVNNGEFSVINKNKIKEFSTNNKDIVEKLENINKVLRRYDLHFGYRVFDEIIMFLYNCQNSLLKFENLDEAFDLAIKMKILPKFHGTRQRLEKPIIEFLRILELNPESKEKQDNENKPSSINLINELPQKIQEVPIIYGKILKVSLGEREIKVKTPYPHTVQKLLQMLYKLKTQGFASFM